MTRPEFRFHLISLAAFAATLLLAAACGGDDSSPPRNVRLEAGLQQTLDAAVATPDALIPGALAYYHEQGYAPWSGSAGVRELDGRDPMRPANRIRAGSILKTLVAAVTLQHVEEGMLSLDQTLTEILPASVTDYVMHADHITLRMLLNHTSGIPNWTTDAVHLEVAMHPDHLWTDDEALAISASQTAALPGALWEYSNTNYTLLGMVLDVVGGKSWRAQVRERVLGPLRMTSTELPEPGGCRITDDHAHGYLDAAGTVVDLSCVDPSMAGASGGNAMVSTEARNETAMPHWYGLGLEIYELGGTFVIGNAGGAAGYATMMFRIPAQDATLVTSINGSDLFANAFHVFIPALRVIDGSAVP
jgi:D-alanyl-D-alanine carboxypeptidase